MGWDIASGLDPTGLTDVINWQWDSIDSEMLDDEVVRYRVFLSGQNLLAEVDGSLQYLGFYTTRTVEARTEAEAESLALDLIRTNEKLLQMMCNEADDPPTVLIEEIVEIVDESEGRNTGFAFYPETTM